MGIFFCDFNIVRVSDEEPSEKFNVNASVAALVKKEDKIRRKNAKGGLLSANQ